MAEGAGADKYFEVSVKTYIFAHLFSEDKEVNKI